MSCLLDTHVLLWALTDDARLGEHARMTLQAGGAHVSSISMLEIEIKASTGKLAVPADLSTRLLDEGWRALRFDAEHAAAVRTFPTLSRHDPFDRALLAQAQVERMTFLTVDRRLLTLGLAWVQDAST